MTRVTRERLLQGLTSGVIGTCLLTVAVTTGLLGLPALRETRGPGAPVASGYRVGDRFDLPVTRTPEAGITLVVFVRSSCSACLKAQPAMNRLVAQASRSAGATAVVVTSAADPDPGGFIAGLPQLAAVKLLSADFPALRLRHVPAFVVIDATGTIVAESAGVPSAEDEAMLADAIAPKDGS